MDSAAGVNYAVYTYMLCTLGVGHYQVPNATSESFIVACVICPLSQQSCSEAKTAALTKLCRTFMFRLRLRCRLLLLGPLKTLFPVADGCQASRPGLCGGLSRDCGYCAQPAAQPI